MRGLSGNKRPGGVAVCTLAVAALTLAACGGGGDEAEEQPAAATEAAQVTEQAPAVVQTTEAVETTEPEAGAGAVTSLVDVESAVVRIVAEGSFRDPEFGEILNVAGSGSDFIIDPSGLAVTNNHVVTGAALLQVYFSDDDRPRNARILAVSECSDLALIDIEDDGYPYLLWHEGAVRPGLEAFAAGYPLGDPEYTLTSGIVSKANADGESEWASVDCSLEHDASLLGGNSGGPLVDANGAVLGINYAGNDLGQAFAIQQAEALRILDRLRAGEDVTSIGVNGQAILPFDGPSGIWVASVESGSPADIAGIRPGDVITRLEGLLLATDGTMATYCDILRTHSADDVLAIEVLRFDTEQILEGRLNTGEPLAESFSFAETLEEEFVAPPTGTPSYSSFVTVEDDTGTLIMDVPAEWLDVDGGPWIFLDTPSGPSITAAGSIGQFFDTWTEPGVFFGASRDLARTLNEEQLLDLVREEFNFSACEYAGRFPYEDPVYTGLYDQFEDCGGEGVIYISLAAVPPERDFIISVQVQLATEADAEALDQVLNSFFVIGDI